MKIAIDARMINMSGIGTYIQHLLKYNKYDVVLGDEKELGAYNVKNIIKFNSPIYGIKEQLKFPYKKLRELKPDILHIPHYNIPIFYRGKMIVTIHDLTHLIYKEFLPNNFAYLYAKFMLGLAIKKSVKVITVSENTKNDIIKIFKTNPEKIEVIYNAAGNEFIKKDKENIKYLYKKYSIPKNKKIIMYVGNLKPHKNLERLLRAFSKINKKDCYLLLVGKAFKKYNVLEKLEEDLKISNKVIHTGMVEQEELVDLYNLADLFVFPSLYEGFGIPILEALACGTPVICSNTSSLPEVGGDVVEYFNPLDVEEIKNTIERKLKDKNNINYEKQLKKFDWEKSVKETKELYRKL